LVPGLSRG